jgi:hypothetical protein
MPRQCSQPNSYGADIVKFKVTHHTLRKKFSASGKPAYLDNLQAEYASGLFQRIMSSEKHTLLCTADSSTIGLYSGLKKANERLQNSCQGCEGCHASPELASILTVRSPSLAFSLVSLVSLVISFARSARSLGYGLV